MLATVNLRLCGRSCMEFMVQTAKRSIYPANRTMRDHASSEKMCVKALRIRPRQGIALGGSPSGADGAEASVEKSR